jgi:hypothetical protein
VERAVAWPIPEVPPTKRTVGRWGGEKAALDARVDESKGIFVGIRWLGNQLLATRCNDDISPITDQETRPQKEITSAH